MVFVVISPKNSLFLFAKISILLHTYFVIEEYFCDIKNV